MRLAWALALLVGCAGARAPATSVDAVAWMAGRWVDPEGGGEGWTRVGAVLLGVGWLRGGDGAWSFEVLRVDAPGGLRFTAWPSGQVATPFAERARGAGSVVFAAPEHDFPKVVRYAQRPGGLVARVEGDRPADGQDFNYGSADPAPSRAAEAADRGLDDPAWAASDAVVWLAARPVVPAGRAGWRMTRRVLASGQTPDSALAYTLGTYTRADAAERGDYVFIWQREGEAWRMVFAVINPA